MANELVNVTVKEVSLVSKGANRKTFCLTKSADPQEVVNVSDTNENHNEDLVAVQKAAAEKIVELEKAQKAAIEKAEALEKALAAERDARELTAEIAKCAVDYKSVPMPAHELAVVVRALRKSADKDVFEGFEKMLKGINALVEKSIEPVGKSTSANAATPWSVIEGKAREVMKSDVKISLAKAVEMVIQREPDLYAQHVAESRG